MNQQWDQSTLDQLNSAAPETESYLERVGYVQNNLLRMREIMRAEKQQPSWMDSLGIEPQDLLKNPTMWDTVTFLYNREIGVQMIWEIPELTEAVDYEHRMLLEDDEGTERWLAENRLMQQGWFTPSTETESLLAESTEIMDSVLKWAAPVVERHTPGAAKPTWQQALLLIRLVMFLDQEPHGLARESILSLLSEPFYVKAGELPQKS